MNESTVDETKDICRVCLEYPDDYITIDTKYSEKLMFLDIYNQLTGLNASLCDDLSHIICMECVEDLKFVYDIVTRAKRSDHILRIMQQQGLSKNVDDCTLQAVIDSQAIVEPKDFAGHDMLNNDAVVDSVTDSENESTTENKFDKDAYVDDQIKSSFLEVKEEPFLDVSIDSITSDVMKSFEEDSCQEAAEYDDQYEKVHTNSNETAKYYVDEDTIFIVDEKAYKKNEEETKKPRRVRGEKFICEFCGKILRSAQHLQVHTYTHTNERNYPCSTCCKFTITFLTFNILTVIFFKARRFATIYRLRDHIQTHSAEKKYQCKYCEKKFASRNSLTCHTRRHTGERPFECKVCGKRFSQTSILKTHLTLHTGKTVECPTCKKTFSRSSHLILHQRDHTGERPYVCHICSNSYKQKSHLDRHLDTHMGIKHKCDICNKEYSKKSTLNVHLRAHFREKQFKCDQCLEEFTSSFRCVWIVL